MDRIRQFHSKFGSHILVLDGKPNDRFCSCKWGPFDIAVLRLGIRVDVDCSLGPSKRALLTSVRSLCRSHPSNHEMGNGENSPIHRQQDILRSFSLLFFNVGLVERGEFL